MSGHAHSFCPLIVTYKIYFVNNNHLNYAYILIIKAAYDRIKHHYNRRFVMIGKYMDHLEKYLSQKGFLISGAQKINYGVQFIVSDGNRSQRVRVYQNNKGKITLDASLIKDAGLKEIVLGFEADTKDYPLLSPPLIGTDEAGKGDYFGAVCVGGVYADKKRYDSLVSIGVKDSKKLTDASMLSLKNEIIKICPNYKVVGLSPATYNEAYLKYKNMSVILSGLHARVINDLYKKTNCARALVDKFSTVNRIEKLLENKNILLKEEVRAEQNAAVAAASILARCAFLESIKQLEALLGMDVPLGAGEAVDDAAKNAVKKFGKDILQQTVKLNFKNTQKI